MEVPAPDSSVAASDEARLTNALRAEQVDQVYRQASRNQVFSPVVATLMAVGLWSSVSHPLLIGWVLLIAVSSVFRQLLARAYLRRRPARLALPIWERRFVVSTAMVGALWGLGGWLFMRGGDGRVDLYVYAYVIGMSGGTSALYAAHSRTVLITVSCILLPPTLTLIWRADVLSWMAALGGVLFVVATISSTSLLKATLRRSIDLAQQLDRLARVDTLSGLANRRELMDTGSIMMARAARTGRPCAALMVDVDHFKRVNDSRGHAAGDAVIAALGGLLARSVRADELAGRLGGEEFAILLPDGSIESATALATRIGELVRSTPVVHADGPIAITVSIGVAAANDGPLQSLLEAADRALYRAKTGGRDRVEVAGQGVD